MAFVGVAAGWVLALGFGWLVLFGASSDGTFFSKDFLGHETNFSTEQPQAQQDARFPRADAHERRAQRLGPSPSARAGEIGRLKGPSSGRFQEIFSTGQRVTSPDLRVFSLPGSGLAGVATSRSIGSKPERNRAKRRVREAFWVCGIDGSTLDWVLVVKASAVRADFETLVAQMTELKRESLARWADASESG